MEGEGGLAATAQQAAYKGARYKGDKQNFFLTLACLFLNRNRA